jgi:hypothetical protein
VTCGECSNAAVVERVEATVTDYRCRCGQLLRVLG